MQSVVVTFHFHSKLFKLLMLELSMRDYLQ